MPWVGQRCVIMVFPDHTDLHFLSWHILSYAVDDLTLEVLGGGSVGVDSLLIVAPIVGFCNCSMFCCSLLCVHSSFAIISMGKRELVLFFLLCLSSWCLVIVVWLFLTMPWVCPKFVIVVFPGHTHLLFY